MAPVCQIDTSSSEITTPTFVSTTMARVSCLHVPMTVKNLMGISSIPPPLLLGMLQKQTVCLRMPHKPQFILRRNLTGLANFGKLDLMEGFIQNKKSVNFPTFGPDTPTYFGEKSLIFRL